MPTHPTQVSQETPLHAAFLQAWKEGIELAGPSRFSCTARSIEDAAHWRQLTPDLAVMRRTIVNKSQAEAYLIAIMASFYNDAEGQKLLQKAGLTFGGGALVVGDKARCIIARLFASYRGW